MVAPCRPAEGPRYEPARDLLADLGLIGARLEPAGDRLILRAGPVMIPAGLVRRVREAKADLLATLADGSDGDVLLRDEAREHGHELRPRQAKESLFEYSVIEWLNQHSVPSGPGGCAWCRRLVAPVIENDGNF
jgi:hypothetical protein